MDRPPTRLGIRMALDAEAIMCIEAEDAEQAIRAAKREQPDLCLLSSEFQGDGFRTLRGICRAAPRAAVIILAQDGDVDSLLDSVRAGAVGYVPGPVDANQLRRVVRAVAAGEAAIPRSMVLELLLELRSGGEGLTPRESQVLRLLRRRHTTAEIAARLQIAPVTVRRHISELVQKLGVDDRLALITQNTPNGGEAEGANRHVRKT